VSPTGIAGLDPSDGRSAHFIQRLAVERAAWLTTVAAEGTPQTSPIWFLWNGGELLIYSRRSPRVDNIRNHPRVAFNLDGNRMGGDIFVVEGSATIDEDAPPAAANPEYLAKYKPVMDEHGWTPEWFTENYPVAIRIEPTRFRFW